MMYELGNDVSRYANLPDRLQRLDANKTVAITGAGISVASGLPLGNDSIGGIELPDFFRAPLWLNEPKRAYEAYREILSSWRTAEPNISHLTLAISGVPVITQNIDGLHRDAGSERLIELHGNLRELSCRDCCAVYTSALAWEMDVPTCPTCNAHLFPGITLEGDPVRHIARAAEWVASANYLLIVGTQMAMDPIRQLRELAQRNQLEVLWVCDRGDYWLPVLLAN
ncbi:SIR2 family NAD-dependent protein deacylase [Alicyclobacillus dauci]|uniref:protein acetyllysine N-acetyltransferase n=1 Tax=Alicyclobacillus dauci TaxID=1475485 RepID=A0ABY6ZAF3_9BACL|nr:Sir2 family NAD-dependent protein deacetylase [Alicyclobacillus dauci]WAH39080.1 iron dicitrate transport regulator FecR [Alicyclobacillus dauci]